MSFHDNKIPFEIQLADSQAVLFSSTSHGFCDAIQATPTEIWEAGGERLIAAGASRIGVRSTDNADRPAGDGAQEVEIRGLDNQGVFLSETIPVNGTQGKLTDGLFRRVNHVEVVSAGDAKINVGDITVQHMVSTTLLGKILAGIGRMRNSHFTVPINMAAYFSWVSFSSPSTDPLTYQLWSELDGARLEEQIWYAVPGTVAFEIPPMRFAPATELWLTARSASVAEARASYRLVLKEL